MTAKKIKSFKYSIFISWGCVIIWMAVIFALSSQPANESNEFSKGFAGLAANTLGQVSIIEIGSQSAAIYNYDLERNNNIIRNYAHSAIFLVLALLVINAFRVSGLRRMKRMLMTIIICSSYAISDELHQLFVPGRACEFSDFIRDTVGIMIGIAIVLILGLIRTKFKLLSHKL